MKCFWALILLSALSPNMGRFVQDFFLTCSIGTSDRYVQQIDRAITTYNFCNFNILGIFHFQIISSIVLLHILSQSTCLSRLIFIEYKNKWNILITSDLSIVYIRQMHILANSRKSTFPTSADFFPLKVLKVTRNFVAFFLYN